MSVSSVAERMSKARQREIATAIDAELALLAQME